MYESSAIFLRLDAPPRETQQSQLFPDGIGVDGMEFLFWGDVESALKLGGVRQSQRTEGEPYGEEVEVDLNRRVWEVAARRWIDGKLGAIFIECSYDSSRPSEFLYGHLKPLGLHAELGILASLVIATRQDPPGTRPLEGLKVCITHVKTSLIPHPSGTTDRERVFSELQALEKMAEREGSALGVQWVMCESGMRIVV
jgi:cAMP phosphodiesterase